MFPSAVVSLYFVERAGPYLCGAIAGTTIAMAMLVNQETGIAVSAGLATGWLIHIQRQNLHTAFLSFVAGASGFAVVVACVALLYHMVLSAWPFPSTVDDVVPNIRSMGGGFAGLRLPLNPIALLILAHAACVFVRTLWFLIRPRSESPNLVSTGLALMLLVFLTT